MTEHNTQQILSQRRLQQEQEDKNAAAWNKAVKGCAKPSIKARLLKVVNFQRRYDGSCKVSLSPGQAAAAVAVLWIGVIVVLAKTK